MSIIIENLEMPSCCGECYFGHTYHIGGTTGMTCDLLRDADTWGHSKEKDKTFKFCDCPVKQGPKKINTPQESEDKECLQQLHF